MKQVKAILIVGCLFIGVLGYTQEEGLFSSISFKEGLNGNNSKKRFEVDDFNGFPKDLSSSKLFFIEIDKDDIRGQYSVLFGPFYRGINRNLIKKIKKKYPYEFESFPKEYQSKTKNFFLDKGFKYRLLINSSWHMFEKDPAVNITSIPSWKQYFSLAIQDIESGTIYGFEEDYIYMIYINKFIKQIRG
ncbi:hypothetical protein [Aquimarina sp. 2201CG5-10]|uniref:hypothetical protein n=1 Tax=Aquimarina callyspongiae TaxID=3098150 RepID=UPI002AB49302|nr:hypothetical protein [Aquimarina sp. 2201CG5-10]MDY8135746.1 hypothetical protein [Aquimarina sp. 2201CG5-10]